MRMFFFLCCVWMTALFADHVVLENQSLHPDQANRSKIAVQWASSARAVEAGNQALIQGSKLPTNTMQFLTKAGKVNLNIPKAAKYFRVLVWSNGKEGPDFHTNWVHIIPNQSYSLSADMLIPTLLSSGMGC